jgi:hypothetical protein
VLDPKTCKDGTVELRLGDDLAHGFVHVEVGEVGAGELGVELVDDLQEALVEVERVRVGLVVAHAVQLERERELEGAASDGAQRCHGDLARSQVVQRLQRRRVCHYQRKFCDVNHVLAS